MMPSPVPPLAFTAWNAVLLAFAVGRNLTALAALTGGLVVFWAGVGYPSVIAERATVRARRMRGWLARDLDGHWHELERELTRGGW